MQNFSFTCLYALTLWFGGHVLISRRMEGHTDKDVNGGDVIVILIALITGMTGISQLRGFKTYVCECGRLTHTIPVGHAIVWYGYMGVS